MRGAEQSLWSAIERKCMYLIQGTRNGASLMQIHAYMLRNALETNVNLLTKFITTCASVAFLTSRSEPVAGILHARRVFDHRFQRDDTFLCNSMIKAYVESHRFAESLFLYRDLRRDTGFTPDGFTFVALAKSCGLGFLIGGDQEVHGHVLRAGFSSDSYVAITLLDMYSKSRKMDCAVKLFDELSERNVVAWTVLIGGYVRSGEMGIARKLFDSMSIKDAAVFNVMIDGYIRLGDMVSARNFFDEMPEKNVVSWTSMICGYWRCGDVEFARSFFDAMPEKNLASWNAMIGGYCQTKKPLEALKLFGKLQSTTFLEPDEVTIISILPAIADLGALDLGKWVHHYVRRNNLETVTKVCTALVDMYTKCGEITTARELFGRVLKTETIYWNAWINGLALNGYGKEALEVFEDMHLGGCVPDESTMISVLSACSHSGLLEEGKKWFGAMEDFGLTPKIEHYGCMVDLFGRAGCLEEAEKLIETMPYAANGIILSSFLFACGCYNDVTRAERVLRNAIKLEPQNDGNYVMLRNLYASERRWCKADQIKHLMRENEANKEVGCSLIEVDGRIMEFLAGDRVSPQKPVQTTLGLLQKHMMVDFQLLNSAQTSWLA